MTAKTLTTCLLAVGTLAAMTASPAPAASRDLPYALELDSCLSAIYRKIDIGGATRVRHVVRESQSSSIGYELTIDTVVYDAEASRAYRAVCLARGALNPIRLRIAGDDA